jgi:hypothetical protein
MASGAELARQSAVHPRWRDEYGRHAMPDREQLLMQRGVVGWRGVAALPVIALLLAGSSQCTFGGRQFGGNGGAATQQTTIAPIGAFGSIFAGGTEFTTSNVTPIVDGTPGDESLLKPGQVITLTGSVASGGTTATATSAAVNDKLTGPVSALDPATASFTLLGQTVQLTGDTSVGPAITPADVSGLTVGEVVVIDGYRTSSGLIASRLDLATGQSLRVAGVVSALDGLALKFSVGATTIDFSKAVGGLPPGIMDGSYVVASGGTATGATTLQAGLVETATESPPGSSGGNGLVHGAITRFGSTGDFDLAGQTVATTASTTFSSGAAADLGPDVELQVVGQYDVNGVLDATSIAVTPAASFLVAGPVASLDATASTLVVAGITLTVNPSTRWDDERGLGLRIFGFSNLSSGNWVEVHGVAGAALAATATIVARRVPPSPAFVVLQGIPAGLAAPNFTLSGVSIDANTATFSDAAGQSLSKASFFAQAANRVVRVTGAFIGSTLTAETVALRP